MFNSNAVFAAGNAAAFVDGVEIDVIHVTGADRVAFLHRLLSGNVAGAPVGGGCHTLLLNLKGHITSDIQLLMATDCIRLMVARGQGQATADVLNRYAVMDDVTSSVVVGQRVVDVMGPNAAAALEQVGANLSAALVEAGALAHAELEFAGETGWCARVPARGDLVFRLSLSEAGALALVEALKASGIPRLHTDEAEALRIEAGDLRFGIETTPERFPMELGLDDAIDYAKGCYMGQEPIVRIRDRGHVNWRIAQLRFEPSLLVPKVGDKLEADARPAAGHLTSVAIFPAFGARPAHGVALGVVHATVPPGPIRVVLEGGSLPAVVL